jgi:hypothetical protein
MQPEIVPDSEQRFLPLVEMTEEVEPFQAVDQHRYHPEPLSQRRKSSSQERGQGWLFSISLPRPLSSRPQGEISIPSFAEILPFRVLRKFLPLVEMTEEVEPFQAVDRHRCHPKPLSQRRESSSQERGQGWLFSISLPRPLSSRPQGEISIPSFAEILPFRVLRKFLPLVEMTEEVPPIHAVDQHRYHPESLRKISYSSSGDAPKVCLPTIRKMVHGMHPTRLLRLGRWPTAQSTFYAPLTNAE